MKKVFLSLAVLASVAMVSCGNKAAEEANAEAADTTATEVVAAEVENVEVLDTVAANDTVAVEA